MEEKEKIGQCDCYKCVPTAYSLEEIRDAAYETLAQVKKSEYEYAESLLWAFRRRLTGEREVN